MIPDLPVWSIRPNWKDGVLERLEWLTDVLTSSAGVEQRRSNRLSPRRSFEFRVNPNRQERSFLDLMMHRLGDETWLAPIWHDKAKLTASVAIGVSRLPFDNRWREHITGGYAIIYKDAFTWEIVEIEDQDDTGLDLADPLTAAWIKGSVVYPLRQMRLATDTRLSALTSRVGESMILMTVTEANDWEAAIDWPTYEMSPIVSTEPNRAEATSLQHVRTSVTRDNETGLTYRANDTDRAFGVRSHSWTIKGREAQASFRSALYALRGRQKMVWLPSFNEDVVASRSKSIGAPVLDIHKIGLEYAGGVIPGRDRVWINGQVVQIMGLDAPESPQEERLTLGGPLTAAVPASRSGSFLEAARLDQDIIEIDHPTDSDGLFNVAAGFRTFEDARVAGGTISFPIPAAEMSDTTCGLPEEGNCNYDVCPGYRSIGMTVTGCNPGFWPVTNLQLKPFGPEGHEWTVNPPIEPGGPSGQSLNLVFGLGGGPEDVEALGAARRAEGYIYESNVYNDPESEWYQHPLAIKLQGQELLHWTKTPLTFLFEQNFNHPGWYVSMQYGPFFCGSVGAEAGGWSFIICSAGGIPPNCAVACAPINMCPEMPCITGNTPYSLEF